ncbi:NAD(P)-dependent oxidoreductase [Cytobacillus firmus]|jgi:3-hydroxyisobutyrate dehydrogenase|uniref:NAD(P)-dependent oxidoreductase n=1 Tax=Cytobacillus firmus TaxID=1399 RepID=A0AA46PAK2_CYTFI|nr:MULTISPECIES: NAD(P)-dependent oxidoreductase [Bacillaceae]MBY6050568.1 NAD(P)-dependent oxidoreductase [Cytobacillus firmus]MCC3645476.1 NAD(P)-dependent oxidoreductase [Cytobacillus oceanisediminis]MCU1804702.1 NAD(P)-dependent oxidoreductase [Cytobacillus firmus]USK40444.1 NAD(P)-dependent oxidoreductase [Cytobacillus firmus]UYG96586.1 NAD(P)-dependent oxidoreductase [Cytobacillus firmus]
MVSPENTVIGFVGTGVMGKSMAGHLLKAGYPLVVYTRTKEKASELIEKGAEWAETPAAVAKKANVIITIVGYPADVEEVYLGENGIITNGRENTYVIDMTTSTPTLAKRIYEEARKIGIYAIDAPVSGGDIGARDAKLSIMAGGDRDAFLAVEPIFNLLGTNIVYQGNAGAGQHTKMCNQIAIASNMIGVCEAVVYAEKAGLDPKTVLQSITSGAAGSWSLSNLAPRMIEGNFEPGFYIKHFIKDMNIALNEAEAMGMMTPGLSLAKKMYAELAENGEENSGTQALYKYWEK